MDGTSPVYVASPNNDQVALFQDMSGTGYRRFGQPGSGQNRLNQPLDIALARLPRQ